MAPFSVRSDPAPGPAGDWSKKVRDLLESGKYSEAVQLAYRSAFDDVVESFGLVVPVSATDREFLRGFLRTDMGRIVDLLPALFQLYEPARFGGASEGDHATVQGLVDGIEEETVLGRLRHPLYRPRSPEPPARPASRPGTAAVGGPR